MGIAAEERRASPLFPAFLDDDHAIGYWAMLLGLPVLLAIAMVCLLPVSVPMPAYLQDAQEYARTGRITDIFFPLGYAFFTGLSIRILGVHGPVALEVLLYLLIVISVWAIARKSGATPRASLIAALLAAIYPQLFASVVKVWDLEMAVLAMTLFMLLIVMLMREGPRFSLAVAIGLAFGAGLSQRPNMLLLVPLPIWYCFVSSAGWTRKLVTFATAGILTVVTLAAINTAAHGSFFLPQNGPYNLAQGHNEFTTKVLLEDLTCEPTIAMILKADGIDPVSFGNQPVKVQQQYYTHRALGFMRSHPLEELKITVAKLWTVFRPNTRIHDTLDVTTMLVICMSLIFPAWLAILVFRGFRTGLDRVDWMFVAATVLYVLPFLITCSDPRYQIPLEICLLAHIAYMAGRIDPLRSDRIEDT
jgi:hypothetical protein